MQEVGVQIDSLPVPRGDGILGLTACPGQEDIWAALVGRRGAVLREDIREICDWGAVALVSLMESAELEALGIADLGDKAEARGLDWYHMPIPDFCAPGRRFEECWDIHGAELRRRLVGGERIVIHCLAGLGRTGTVAARILVEQGMRPRDAVRAVRAARPGAIQSEEQFEYVLNRAWEV